MSGLVDHFNILAASHATLLTMLKEIANAKKGEKGNTRHAKSYRPSSRTSPHVAPRTASSALQQPEPVIEEVTEDLVQTTTEIK